MPASPSPTSVVADLTVWLVDHGSSPLPVGATLRYDPADPYAVAVMFRPDGSDGPTSVEWTFARQLLTEGTTGPVGEGDVVVWPKAEDGLRLVCLSLSSPSGRALFEASLSDVVGFLGQTYALVPTGGEADHVDMDAEIAALLAG